MPDEISDDLDQMGNRLDVRQSTWVRLGTVFAVLGALWTAYSWLDARFAKVEERFNLLQTSATAATVRMDDAMRRIEATTADQWTRTDQRLWMLELALQNRTLKVPTVAESRAR